MAMLMITGMASLAFAEDYESPVGNVVLVKRTFPLNNFEECEKTYIHGYNSGCTVDFLPKSDEESVWGDERPKVHYFHFPGHQNTTLSAGPTRTGYIVNVNLGFEYEDFKKEEILSLIKKNFFDKGLTVSRLVKKVQKDK